jgi:hypothetical protein
MTDSPTRGLSTAGAPALEHAPNHDHPNITEPHPTRLLRPEQRAPSGVGVKDLRPLRGRPFGPILDPDASSRRAHKQAENRKKKDHRARRGLTGPAPSGMTAGYVAATRLTSGNS